VDGNNPNGGLVLDKAGNLYGTTPTGGTCCGTVFELSPPSQPGGAWTETVIHEFSATGEDGQEPMAGLVIDNAGNLYGTTIEGGSGTFGFGGTAFELSPPSQPGGPWNETIIYNFGSFATDGYDPHSPLIFDSSGNLYGTTEAGGTFTTGTVYQLSPPSQSGAEWTETILHSFGSIPNDGRDSTTGLTLTPSGALLGTTQAGGIDYGVVFALSPPSTPGGPWHYGLPYIFRGFPDSTQPQSSLTLIPGKAPALYGTTYGGGVYDKGTVFRLTPPTEPGGGWTETLVYTFTGGSDGGSPSGGVLLQGYALYGTTALGGSLEDCGTAFRLSQ